MQHNFSIEILEKEALQLIDPKAVIEVIGSGYEWTEGPLWVSDGNYLLFSDIPNNKIFQIDAEGNASEYLHPSGYLGEGKYGSEPGSNGLLLSPDGDLILMQHGERQVAKMKSTLNNPRPEYETLVGDYKGKRFNSPNDGVFDGDGNLYFTDPPYGLPEQMDDPNKELDFQGVYCLKTSGELVLVDTLSRPNGIALSPDGSKLYVAVSDPQHAVWYQYDVTNPGVTTNKRIFFDVTDRIGQAGQPGLPDGMKMHSKGYLFATGPGGVWVFNEGGQPIARIYTGLATANCAFSPDEQTLFMTADDFVLKLKLK
ncbi:MAG TPA: SMP-30/gluconolactonase/LRE family protein [Pricia sp.]|nr:SMP-30/gluconolactonase/LRE family protein [Pricia sp.]